MTEATKYLGTFLAGVGALLLGFYFYTTVAKAEELTLSAPPEVTVGQPFTVTGYLRRGTEYPQGTPIYIVTTDSSGNEIKTIDYTVDPQPAITTAHGIFSANVTINSDVDIVYLRAISADQYFG